MAVSISFRIVPQPLLLQSFSTCGESMSDPNVSRTLKLDVNDSSENTAPFQTFRISVKCMSYPHSRAASLQCSLAVCGALGIWSAGVLILG